MKDILIQEQLNPNIKTALYSNFSNAYEAIQEIIDNSISHRIPGKKMQVKIFFIQKPKKIEIQDIGGEGMNIKDLKFFFNWGGIRSRNDYDVGLYGQGGKSAIGYLGRSFILTTSPVGGNEAYRIEDYNLTDTSRLKKYRVMPLPAASERGYTKIEIENLRFNITDNFKRKLKEILISAYRPLIENKEVELIIDEQKINVTPFPLDEDFTIERVDFGISKSKHTKGWIGRLLPRSGLKGGIRCYYKGRLICDREFFRHPDPSYKATLNFLFGEMFLDFVPVNTNKTDFKRDTEEWMTVEDKMFSILKSHVDELLGRKVEEPTGEDIERVKKARDLFQVVLKLIHKENQDNISVSQEYDYGQKSPESRETTLAKHRDEIQKRKKYQPRTSPPPDKIGIRKRLKKFMDWEIRSMEETIRSKIEETKGEKEEEKGKILVINNMFPGYKESKGNPFYLLETAALQTVPIEDATLTPQKYLEEFDHFFGKICEHVNEAKEMMGKKKKGK
ncbi:ATP-binding protein [Candidatus Parcubacteria bacterium]|nr:ATP-binding protein [Candidatus Parcubacteria bacterium]